MGKINIKDLKSGMKLASPIYDRNRRLLIPAGGELTETTIERLGSWGVLEADIDGIDKKKVDDVKLESVDTGLYENIKAQVEELYSLSDRDYPPVREMIRVSVMRAIAAHKESEKEARRGSA